LNKVISNGLIHATVAGEAEVYDRHIQSTPQDIGVYQTWAARASTVRDTGTKQ
jgi:hypothetical protein